MQPLEAFLETQSHEVLLTV